MNSSSRLQNNARDAKTQLGGEQTNTLDGPRILLGNGLLGHITRPLTTDRSATVCALAERRLVEAKAEVRRLTDFLEMYHRLSGRPVQETARRSRCRLPESRLRALCIEALRERGEPMGWRALHAALTARGHTVDGANPRNRIVTAMWRGGAPVIHTHEGYALSSETPPAADGAVERHTLSATDEHK